MPYQGTANVTVSAEYFGHDPVVTENSDVTVRLQNVAPGLVELHFTGRLNSPTDATHVRITLPNGLVLGGAIKQYGQETAGDWLSFSADLGLK